VVLAMLSAARLTAQGRIVTDSVISAALEGNRYGDSPVRRLLVYLPPGYDDDTSRRYPAVYLLHGYGASPDVWINGAYQGLDLRVALDSLVGAGVIPPLVVILPDGRNRLGGSVFTDSYTTGGWETYLVRDVVNSVERRYRVLRRAASRGIAGHSMGAAAALRIAMRSPSVFGAAYGMSPNADVPCTTLDRSSRDSLLTLARLTQADSLGFWGRACLGYAAAWSPDSARPPFFLDLPFVRHGDSIVADSAVLERWTAWRLLDMAPRYRDNLVRLRGMGFDVGTEDSYLPGVARLDSLMTRLRVRHQFATYPGDHASRIRERVTGQLFPFFAAVLNFDPEGT
jgi:enterochelin esterase-like enzyme